MSRKHGDSFTDENGRVWMKLRPAEREVRQTERNIREWVKPSDGSLPKVPGQQLESRKNAPWYVDIQALKEFLRDVPPDPKVIVSLSESELPKGKSLRALAQPPTAAISVAVDHIREINEDWRQNAEKQSAKVESVLAEQLKHERQKRQEAEEKVSALQVELALKETPAEPHREPWSWRHVFSR